jgi:protein-tyrosine phosphatase
MRRAPHWLRVLGRFALDRRERSNRLHEWRRRVRGEPVLPALPIRSVLVICHGNICRSPFAERLLAQSDAELTVRSAGLEAGSGRPAEPAARHAAEAYGVGLDGHRSQPMDDSLVDWADLILAMEGHQLAAVGRRWPSARDRTRLLGDFLADGPYAIPDPWGREPEVFRATFAQIAGAVARLEERLRAGSEAGEAPVGAQATQATRRKN